MFTFFPLACIKKQKEKPSTKQNQRVMKDTESSRGRCRADDWAMRVMHEMYEFREQCEPSELYKPYASHEAYKRAEGRMTSSAQDKDHACDEVQ